MLNFHKVSFVLMALAVLTIGAMSVAYGADYLAVGNGGGVYIYNPTSGAVVDNTHMAGLPNPDGILFAPDGYTYISAYQARTDTRPWDVARYQTGSWTTQEAYATVTNHESVGIGYSGGALYTANVGGHIFETIGGVTTEINSGMGGDCRGMAIDSAGILYLASQGSNHISRLDTTTNVKDTPWAVRLLYPNNVAVGPDATGDGKSDLYVTYWAQTVIDIYDGSTGAFHGVYDDILNYVASSGIWSQAWGVAFDGTTGYFTDPGEGIVFKKVGNAAATMFITGLSSPRNLAIAQPVPEPASLLALGSGLLGLAAFARRRRA